MSTLENIEKLESALLRMPQVELPLTHMFAPGVYWREMFAPAGTLVVGHMHKTKHFNVLLSGKMVVLVDGKPFEMKAPEVFVSEAGVRKVAYVTQDMRFVNIFPTAGLEHCGEDIAMLEDELRTKSDGFLEYEAEAKLLSGGTP
jgi:hypothetical protein